MQKASPSLPRNIEVTTEQAKSAVELIIHLATYDAHELRVGGGVLKEINDLAKSIEAHNK